MLHREDRKRCLEGKPHASSWVAESETLKSTERHSLQKRVSWGALCTQEHLGQFILKISTQTFTDQALTEGVPTLLKEEEGFRVKQKILAFQHAACKFWVHRGITPAGKPQAGNV